MKTPSAEEFRMAAEWLEIHDIEDGSDGDPGVQCHSVADWLREYASKIELNTLIKKAAKDAGVPYAKAKKFLAAKQRTQHEQD